MQHTVQRTVVGLAILALVAVTVGPVLAQSKELTACAVVTVADAERLVGGALNKKEIAKVRTADGPNTYNSVCTYVAKSVHFDNTVGAPRMLDLTLHFLQSTSAAKELYGSSIAQYREMAQDPEFPYKNGTITPLVGFGDNAFVLEGVTDPKTKFKSTLIMFTKGAVGGTVVAWNKPAASVETTKTVLKHILSKLP